MDPRPKHERRIEHDRNGAPILPKVAGHIVTFERMLRFRAAALEEQVESSGVLSHYAKEKAALAAGIAALRYHKAAVQGLPVPLEVLRDIVTADDSHDAGALIVAIHRARGLLSGYPANEDLLPLPEAQEG